ncbi:MAG: zinc ribbon domain-containing protein [Chloroflexota bacterium]|jgi:putative FmdB family regulatory protein
MPYYEYRCQDCKRRIRLFFTYEEYDTASPVCPNCQSDDLQRLISRVALAKSEDSRLASLDEDSLLAGLDEEDPRALGRAMRKMNQEMGEDLGPEFDEIVDRLESGQSPEDIERSMPDLSDDIGPGIDSTT